MSKGITTPISELREVRLLMQRSRYFIGLSGLSGIGAGCAALLGVAAVVAYRAAGSGVVAYTGEALYRVQGHPWGIAPLFFLLSVATIVLALAGAAAYYFTYRRTSRIGQAMGDAKTLLLLKNLAIPLGVGGIFCAALLYYGHGALVAATTLLFYGMALLNGSNFVSEQLRNLAYLEIATGLAALFAPAYGLLFWAFGFGVLHIGYGIWMYRKYDSHE